MGVGRQTVRTGTIVLSLNGYGKGEEGCRCVCVCLPESVKNEKK